MNKNLIHEMAKIEKNYWWFVQKRQFVKLLINSNFKKNIKNVLDCGCGTGENLKMLSKYGKVYGIDFDNDCIKYCTKKGFKNIYKQDLNKEFLLPQKMNLIVATDVLEHIKNDTQAYKSIIDNLKYRGIAIITVPAHQFLFSEWDRFLQHKRRYTKKSFAKLISSKNNVTCIKIGYYNLLSFIPAFLSRKIIRKVISNQESEFKKIPNIINKILIYFGYIDNFLATKLPFYFGLSLYAVIKKTSD